MANTILLVLDFGAFCCGRSIIFWWKRLGLGTNTRLNANFNNTKLQYNCIRSFIYHVVFLLFNRNILSKRIDGRVGWNTEIFMKFDIHEVSSKMYTCTVDNGDKAYLLSHDLFTDQVNQGSARVTSINEYILVYHCPSAPSHSKLFRK